MLSIKLHQVFQSTTCNDILPYLVFQQLNLFKDSLTIRTNPICKWMFTLHRRTRFQIHAACVSRIVVYPIFQAISYVEHIEIVFSLLTCYYGQSCIMHLQSDDLIMGFTWFNITYCHCYFMIPKLDGTWNKRGWCKHNVSAFPLVWNHAHVIDVDKGRL